MASADAEDCNDEQTATSSLETTALVIGATAYFSDQLQHLFVR